MTGRPVNQGAGMDSAEIASAKLYVYSVVSGGDYQPAVTGIEGTPLHLVGDPAGPRAVVHTHDQGPYDGPDEDVKMWILQHSEVIEDGWRHAGTVLPVSFNVIVRPDLDSGTSATEQLERWLAASTETLSQRLSQLEGTSELRVEISLDKSAFLSDNDDVRSIKAEMDSRPAGVRRLLEKRLAKTENELADRAADELYPGTRARIAAQCLEIEEYRAPVRDADHTPILMASCLVTEPGIQDLGAELTAIQNDHAAIFIRFLGPWPPYSFADMAGSETQLQARQD